MFNTLRNSKRLDVQKKKHNVSQFKNKSNAKINGDLNNTLVRRKTLDEWKNSMNFAR